jgi:beta-lactamase superfamily II metal-dependent hydrolase
MKIHLLDVGEQQYGDCILVEHEGKTILIDGGHPRDAVLIGEQLAGLLGPSPHRIDLLIVTHCHADHIGCLPELVESGTIDVQKALVADETLGWPHYNPSDDRARESDSITSPNSPLHLLSEALLEEPLVDSTDEELSRFLEDVGTIQDKYLRMLDAFPRVVRYGTASQRSISALERQFDSFGLKIIGPTKDHLKKCAEFIVSEAERNQDVAESDQALSETDLIAQYRRAVEQKLKVLTTSVDSASAEDRIGPGSARNNQSIVVKVSGGGFSALLAGDMQFAAPEVPGLDGMMTALREKIKDAGPFDFVKLTHHTSYNGFDESVLNDYPGCKNFAHTGGLYDPKHPDPAVLQFLAEQGNEIYFARTDRNGLITVSRTRDGMRMEVARGGLNNFEANRRRPNQDDPYEIKQEREAPLSAENGSNDYVEVTAKVPHRSTRVTITIDVDPEKKK